MSDFKMLIAKWVFPDPQFPTKISPFPAEDVTAPSANFFALKDASF
jgi:hypothetical protein